MAKLLSKFISEQSELIEKYDLGFVWSELIGDEENVALLNYL